MLHDLFILIDRNALGFFILALALIWATERLIQSFINRNKPVCDCDCCQEPHDEDEDEVIAGGEEEDDDSE